MNFIYTSNNAVEELRKITKINHKKKSVIVIAGPTASGKTKLSIEIANLIGGEIISCDSMQIYRGANIGTAKPTKLEMGDIKHNLIDLCNINESFNVVNFYNEALSSLQKILDNGSVPILVGGSGFYMHSFLYGPPKGPPSDDKLRKRIEEDFDKYGHDVLYGKLYELDRDYACSITTQDRHKIIRALEIIAISGKKVSEIPKPSQEDAPNNLNFLCWFLYYPKPILYQKIEQRCDEMIQKGILEEVIKLKVLGLEENKCAANSIGYRQCLTYLNSQQSKSDWNCFVTSFKQASRNYAKRQFTWFKREKIFRWLDLSQLSKESVLELIIQDFERAK